jgi:GTPase SAR1 family protein
VELREDYNRGRVNKREICGICWDTIGQVEYQIGMERIKTFLFFLYYHVILPQGEITILGVNPPYQFIGLSMKLEKYHHIRRELLIKT